MSRHTFRLGIIAIALAAAAGCGVGNAALIERDVIEETLPFESGDLFNIENVNGRVTIDTWEEESVRIEAEKRASSERRLERTRVEIEETPRGVRVRTRLPKVSFLRGSSRVDYHIQIPAYARVEVKTVNGRIRITGLKGEVSAKTVNGGVDIEDAGGEVKAATVNGSLRAEYSSVAGSGRSSFRTVNGRVRVTLPEDASADVEARTVNGRISTDFDLETAGRWGSRRASGRLGAGGATLEIETVNGSVSIKKN